MTAGVSVDNNIVWFQTGMFDNSHRSYSDLVVEDLQFMKLPNEIINYIYYEFLWDRYIHAW